MSRSAFQLRKKKCLQFEVKRKLVCNGSSRRAVSIDGNIFEVNNFLSLSLSLVSPHNFEIKWPHSYNTFRFIFGCVTYSLHYLSTRN